MAKPDNFGGMFGWATPTPQMLSLWLQVCRTTLGWSIADAARLAEVDVDTVTRLDAFAEPLSEDDDDVLCSLAYTFGEALESAVAGCRGTMVAAEMAGVAASLKHYEDGLRGDWCLSLARCIRQRRAALGLTVAEVAARAGGVPDADQIAEMEWSGVINDYDDDLRGLAKALEIPFFALHMLAERGRVAPEDVVEWLRWRTEQDTAPPTEAVTR